MHDPWIEKLSEHLDGGLGETEERELIAHLEECADCRGIAAELRAVIAAAQSAPAIESERDLWSGIAARLGDNAADTPAQNADIPGRRFSMPGMTNRRFSFSMPQLAAAAVLLMAMSGAGVWMVAHSSAEPAVAAGTIIQSAGDDVSSVRLVSSVPPPEYREDIAGLERALEENRGQLDPTTIEVIERSLATIDAAIADARSALAADPGNPYLYRQLDNTMQKKIDVLRRATGVQRAQS